MEDDDAALAEHMTGYPAEQDAFHLESLEEQKKVWFSGIGKETFVTLQMALWDPGSRAAGRAGTRTGPAGMVYGVSFDGKCGVFDAYFGKPDSRSADFSPRPALYRKCFLPASGTKRRGTVRTDG